MSTTDKQTEQTSPKLRLVKSDTQHSRCPICSDAAVKPHTPFCSRRCSQIDLGRWLDEAYAIPSEEAGDFASLDEMLEQADKDTPFS